MYQRPNRGASVPLHDLGHPHSRYNSTGNPIADDDGYLTNERKNAYSNYDQVSRGSQMTKKG